MTRTSEKTRGTANWFPTDEPITVGEALKALSEPRVTGEPVKRAIERAAKLSKTAYWRAWDIWYGKARHIEDHEAVRITEALERKIQRDARNELSELRLRLARLESVLVQTDPDFHRENLNQIRLGLRGSR